MKNFKTSLLIATAIASATASGAFAQTFVTPAPNTSGTVATPGPITAQSYVTDASVANV